MAQLPKFTFFAASVTQPSPEKEDCCTSNDHQHYDRQIHGELLTPVGRCLTSAISGGAQSARRLAAMQAA
jgi:hypothetical protein